MIFPVSTNGGGQGIGFPDVCKTPAAPSPIPIPYPNIAMCTQASGGSCSSKVKISGKKVIVKSSEISMSSGDEPGSLGGVVSSKFKGPAQYKKGSSRVKAEGKEVCHLLSPLGMNGGSNANLPGVQIAPSQTKVMVTP